MSPAVDAGPARSVEPMDLASLDLDSFAGRPIAVLGFARSGIALARFLADRGADVTVYDTRPAADLAAAIGALGDRRVRLLLGPAIDPSEALSGQALVTASPSINSRYPTTEPRLREALGRLEAEGRTPVVSEVDLFLRLCPALTVGVTGTKGKTTTSSLIAEVLSAASHPVVLGGNIGTPLVERLPELTLKHRVVLELSELQLPTLSRGTDVSVYTHVTSDHLDRHGTIEAYRAVKRRLAELTMPSGALVLNAEDPVSGDLAAAAPKGTRIARYRRGRPADGELGVVDGWLVTRGVDRLEGAGGADPTAETGPDGRLMPLSELTLPGEHNVSNILAALAVGTLLGVVPDGMRSRVAAFTGVEHRLEPVAMVDGVRFVNDSQGTQPDAVIAALRSFDRPLVLIAGGRDKGLPIDELSAVVAERADAAVLIGETADQLARAFRSAGLGRIERAADLERAVATADAIARESLSRGVGRPATVLLSPAAASFDMFVDYAERGRVFKSAVDGLRERREAGGRR